MKLRRRLGDDFVTTATTVANAVTVGAQIVQDPALPAVVADLAKLHDQEVYDSGDPNVQGIGLDKLVTPIHLYVLYRQNPLVYGTIGLALFFGVPMLIGYYLAKK